MNKPSDHIVYDTIAALAETPAGFGILDLPAAHQRNGYKVAHKHAAAGMLIKVNGGPGRIRYFTDAALAAAYQAACDERHQQLQRERTAKATTARRLRRAQQPRPAKARPVDASPSPQQQSRPSALPRPSAALKPRQDAEIIYPPHYKKTVRLMAQPRNQVVSLPFVHSGMGAMR